MSKFLNKLLSIALVVGLMVVMIAPVFADGVNRNEPGSPTELIVTKNLFTNAKTTIPDLNFTFELMFIGSEADVFDPFEYCNWVYSGTLEFTDDDLSPSPDPAVPGDIREGNATTGNLLAGIVWPSAGQFDFLLRERPDSNLIDTELETVWYDDTVYLVRVSVNSNGNVIGVAVWDFPNRSSLDDVNDLCTVVIENLDEVGKAAPEFSNIFIRSAGLEITKRVDGAMANQNEYFEFSVNLTAPAFTRGVAQTARVVNADGSPAFERNAAGELIVPNVEWVIEFTLNPGESVTLPTVWLRNDQSLVFENLPIPTSWTVTEVNSGSILVIDVWEGGNHMDIIGSNDTGVRVITEGGQNAAVFTNSVDIPLTGLLAENLPFILIGLAAIGFFVIVVIGKKRRAYE